MRLITFFFVFIFTQIGLAQKNSVKTKAEEKIKMTTFYGSTNRELQDILFFEGIDQYTVQFVGKELKNKHFKVIAKSVWDGKITKTDTIINTSNVSKTSLIQSDTLSFKVLEKKVMEDKLKVNFSFKQFSNQRMYDATNSLDYSLRSIGDKMSIEIGKPFPAFAYILPYEKDGWKLYCAVDSSGKNVESWGKEFGIKHYIIYEILFE